MIAWLLLVLAASLVTIVVGACFLSGALMGVGGVVGLVAGVQLVLRLEPLMD